MRIFIAIDFPESVKQSLGYLCAGLPGIKWVDDHQFHLTLRFIGEVDGSVYRDIIDVLSEISFPEFNIVLAHVGTFPMKGPPGYCGLEWSPQNLSCIFVTKSIRS